MSILQPVVERLVRGLKGDPGYRIATSYSDGQLAIVLWHRARQLVRALPLHVVAWRIRAPVFRGRRVVVEHARQLSAGPGLILEDGVFLSALSRDGIVLGHTVTIARGGVLTCTGVLADLGVGIRIGNRSAVGAGAFLGGQGGIHIGDDVIIGPGARMFSENHAYASLDRPIRAQGHERAPVVIGDDCWIGSGATILAGVSIGHGCVVAAGAVVTHDVPPLCMVAGVPARVVRWRQPEAVRESQPVHAELELSAARLRADSTLREDR
jgi:acetyltransferase-like isoleucine patch superfamily enzyme